MGVVRLDMQATYTVDRVEVFNRIEVDAYRGRLDGATVRGCAEGSASPCGDSESTQCDVAIVAGFGAASALSGGTA